MTETSLRSQAPDAQDASGEPTPAGGVFAGSAFQDRAFLSAWTATRARAIRSRIETLSARDETGATFAFPVEIVRFGPVRVGRFPGETHANANGPQGRPRGRLDLEPAARGLGLDALDLRRIPDPGWLPALASVLPAAEERFAISLAGGLEAVLARGNAKRKRKKFRAQQRHFETRGGYRFGDLGAQARRPAIERFLELKAVRFAELGRPDPFRDPGIAAFLQRLFDGAEPDARLYALESGGAIKAMMGGLVHAGTFWGMVSAFSDDEDADVSPGELLLWHLVETLSAEGLRTLDLGPGEERYKRSWCDTVVPQHDATLAVTPKGRLYVSGAAFRQRLVRRVKAHARLLALVQRLRRRLARS